MPKPSDRKDIVNEIEYMIKVIASFDDDDANEQVDELMEILDAIKSTRYLNLREYEKKNRTLNVLLFCITY